MKKRGAVAPLPLHLWYPDGFEKPVQVVLGDDDFPSSPSLADSAMGYAAFFD